jgi:predicted RecB family nuclease
MQAETATVAEILKADGFSVSAAEVKRWKRHAQAWNEQRPIFFGDHPTVAEPFIAIDLEYSETLIWLVGACLVKDGDEQYLIRWADDADEESGNLRELVKLFESHPSLPIVTWAGRNAEIPRLAHIASRLRARVESVFAARHIDLYQLAYNEIRFPTPTLGLKESRPNSAFHA